MIEPGISNARGGVVSLEEMKVDQLGSVVFVWS